MPEYRYIGDFNGSQRLTNPQTVELSADDIIPSYPITVQRAWARVKTSTTARVYTYQYQVTINGGYAGSLEYQFDNVDNYRYINIPITVTPDDPFFPLRTIDTITVSEVGGHGDSLHVRDNVYVYVEYATVGEPTPPSNPLLNGRIAIDLQASYPAELTWTAGAVGSHDEFFRYEILRFDPLDSSYTLIGNTTNLYYEIVAPYDDGHYYYYYVRLVSRYKSAVTAAHATIYTFIPLTAPTFLTPNPYNPRPMVLTTIGEGPRSDNLSLVANGWTPSRKALPESKIYFKRNSPYSAATSETVVVTETDEMIRTVTGNLSIAYAPISYTQSDVIAGTTIVRAADITELQDALNVIRYGYGMSASVFTACVAGVTSLELWQTHITELHNSIREIQTFVNSWDTQSPTYAVILPSLLYSLGPNAAVINQIRTIITML